MATTEIWADNAPELLSEGIWKLRTYNFREETRNGPVYSLPGPAIITVRNPEERVLFDPIRDANPFFHVMEAIWMFAGRRDVEWILQFNKNYINYAEGDGNVNGAYGYRWLNHFGQDQIHAVVRALINNPNSRRAVIAHWDAGCDLEDTPVLADVPCNTHIYFRVLHGELHMTICNRSNDLVWGMAGANIVHFSMLQELIAHGLGRPMGYYHVFTNNLHFYPEAYKNGAKLWKTYRADDRYRSAGVEPFPLLQGYEQIHQFLLDAHHFCEGRFENLTTVWMNRVALPMFHLWHNREPELAAAIESQDWRIACREWILRRT